MTNPNLVRYAPAGRFRPRAVVVAAIAVVASATLGFAYGWASSLIPSATIVAILPILVAYAIQRIDGDLVLHGELAERLRSRS